MSVTSRCGELEPLGSMNHFTTTTLYNTTNDISGSQRKCQEVEEEKEQSDLKIKDLEDEIREKSVQYEESVNERKKVRTNFFSVRVVYGQSR